MSTALLYSTAEMTKVRVGAVQVHRTFHVSVEWPDPTEKPSRLTRSKSFLCNIEWLLPKMSGWSALNPHYDSGYTLSACFCSLFRTTPQAKRFPAMLSKDILGQLSRTLLSPLFLYMLHSLTADPLLSGADQAWLITYICLLPGLCLLCVGCGLKLQFSISKKTKSPARSIWLWSANIRSFLMPSRLEQFWSGHTL